MVPLQLLSLTRKDKNTGVFYFFLFMAKEELNLQVSAGKLLRKIFHFRKGELSGEIRTFK
jgi:hypothetical protein